jgi:hypothetical protein
VKRHVIFAAFLAQAVAEHEEVRQHVCPAVSKSLFVAQAAEGLAGGSGNQKDAPESCGFSEQHVDSELEGVDICADARELLPHKRGQVRFLFDRDSV